MHELPERLLREIRRQELLRAGERVGVAVSGGIDSVALLRLLLELRGELGIVLSVVHFNHKLRGAESDADQEFVAGLAREHGLGFHVDSGDAAARAAEEHAGLEAAARELRYGFFQRLLSEGAEFSDPQELKPRSHFSGSDGAAEAAPFQSEAQSHSQLKFTKIATGHTADDQAETVLMRAIRGTGLRGLAGIYPRIVMERDDGGQAEIVRPLLTVRRPELEKYLCEIKQQWREDGSNSDLKFTRNRLRSMVMPVLEREFNPTIVESLSELAEIARDEEDYWENEVAGWLGTVVQWSEPKWSRGAESLVQIQAAGADVAKDENLDEPGIDEAVLDASVSRPWLVTEPIAVQRRVVKAVGEQAGVPLEFKHVEEILRFAAEDGPCGKALSLPLGWKVVREAEEMVFTSPNPRGGGQVRDFQYELRIPGRVFIPELGVQIEGLLLTFEADAAEYNSQQLLRAELLPAQVVVRNWRAGDRFFPAHTKAPKKVKELLQEKHITGQERRLWPVVVSQEEIVWMRGFPAPAKYRAHRGEKMVVIRESADRENEEQ